MLASVLGLVAACTILLWVYLTIKTRHMMGLTKNIPGPKPLPIIGNGLEFGITPKDFFLNTIRLAGKYGSIFRFFIGSELYIALGSPDLIQVILSDAKTLDKPSVYDVFHPWLGTGLLTSTGEKWKKSRKLITPAFHFKVLEAFVEVFNSNADILVKKLVGHVNGSEFDIYPYITLCAMDTICETSMGLKINAQHDSNSECVKATNSICETMINRMFNPFLGPDILFRLSPSGRQQQRDLDVLHGMTNNVIKERRKKLLQTEPEAAQGTDPEGIKKRVPFLDLLIQSEDGATLSNEDLCQEVNTFIFTGHDTTSSSLSFILWSLASNQHIQERVMLELKDIFGDSDRSPTLHDLHEMKYLEMVIKETLRMLPVVCVFGRKVNESTQVGEYMLPEGANLFIMIYTMHNNPKYFPDPEKFDPDRFLPENTRDRHPYSYIPFAAGSRNCMGQRYAMLMLKSSASTILRRYKLLPGVTPLDLANGAVLRSLSGINIKVELRKM